MDKKVQFYYKPYEHREEHALAFPSRAVVHSQRRSGVS
jgi:hypothetical protein